MKRMFLSSVIAMISLLYADLNGQEYTIAANSGVLHLEQVRRVTLQGSDDNEITIKRQDKGEIPPERAKGLKLVNPGGWEDNTGIGLNITKEGDLWIVREVSNRSGDRYVVRLPKSIMVHYEFSGMYGGTLEINNVTNEIDVATNYNPVKLSGVTGPMAVHTVYGGIDADFKEVSQEGSISLYSVYSYVDVSIPDDSKASFEMSSDWGEVYSNLDLEYSQNKDGLKNLSKRKFISSLNGGGVDFQVRSAYGNVYLRKK